MYDSVPDLVICKRINTEHLSKQEVLIVIYTWQHQLCEDASISASPSNQYSDHNNIQHIYGT